MDVLRLDSTVFFRMVWQLEPEPEPEPELDTEQDPITGPCPEPRMMLEPPVTMLEQLDSSPNPQVPPDRMALPPPTAERNTPVSQQCPWFPMGTLPRKSPDTHRW